MTGVMGSSCPARARSTIATVSPAGAIFFCAPAKITPYFDTSTGRERMSDDISHASGTPPVSGTYCHSVP